ncbi:hypothetical protein O7606_14510 [Micromonospora sp. WMMD882]|uniref:hypothetical protein n=1 Tax=Micromonospora sp. WMMD882 TaxID=3015151 RepID=UPI00248D0654|nr:hypothetical protein [Micromonospora sp. WMMD882]WBB77499.1 hypothetical protein O7606_14510 [Micromonospora sp. WMMD882]
MVPAPLAQSDLAAGHCVDLAPGRHLDVPLHWQHWRLESTLPGALTAAVRAVAAETLRQEGPLFPPQTLAGCPS